MARLFSTPVQTVLNSTNRVKYFFLIELVLGSTYNFTSFYRDISWDSKTWNSDGGLFEVDSPQFSSIVDREAYRVVLTDLDDTLQSEFRSGVIGKAINVYVGFCDSNGDPLTGAGDIVSIYSGYVDSPQVAIDWETKTASIEGTSPMADLDQVKTVMVSRDGMDQFDATDTAYDRIFEDSETLVKWGKI